MSNEEHAGVVSGLDKLYEFDREPVSDDKLQPGKYFAGLLAGEHVAGTEFVIGASFVWWGATPYDIFVGLALGNLLAVLTWTFMCAPIATQTRLTLYWYLRKIAGPAATAVYNVLNAVLFCILAGCMITVSASAVRIPFNIPPQVHWYPESAGFVVVVLVVGAVVTTLAILGFKRVAQFGSVCSPWMFLMFMGGAVAMLPALALQAGLQNISSWSQFWTAAREFIWTGDTPDGSAGLSFWHITAFAWICNLAMHGGLSDMALFRYARHWSYGLYSAFGMFFGHYLAWIFAGIMGAATARLLQVGMGDLDAGGVAWQALGVTGILAVVIAGWTTSNPTLYRAGLAFQGVTPGWPRWLVTLFTGVATTIIACFPFVFTKLLNFVGLYGLLLVPVGAIVFVEHWIFPRIGFTRYWVSRKKLFVSWPALISWGVCIAFALIIEEDGILLKLFALLPAFISSPITSSLDLVREHIGTLHLFFLFLPVWFLTAILYAILAALWGAREKLPEDHDIETAQMVDTSAPPEAKEPAPRKPEKADIVLWTARVVAILSLAACLVLPFWVYSKGASGYDTSMPLMQKILIWPTLIYFVSGTVWAIRRDKQKEEDEPLGT
jgi:cytosine permease